jgi:hypothetical protein
MGNPDVAGYVIGCHFTSSTRVQSSFYDMASNICQALICGDGAGMAKAVHATLCKVLEKKGGLDATAAAAKLVEMTKVGVDPG